MATTYLEQLLLQAGDVEMNPGPKDRPTKEYRDQDSDSILQKVAEQIQKDTDIYNLGGKLEFEHSEIKRYMESNKIGNTVTYMGTLDMLHDWKKRTKRSEEREKLKKALNAIDYQRLADDLLNDDMTTSESFTAISSTNGSPGCVVRHCDQDVYSPLPTDIRMVALFKHVFWSKRIVCTPYIPVSTPKNAEHLLFIHVRDGRIDIGKEEHPGYIAPVPGERFYIPWRSGGIKITCNESIHTENQGTTLRERDLRRLTEQKVMFLVDTRATDMKTVILHFSLEQGNRTKQLIFPMHLEGGNAVVPSPRPSSSTSGAIPFQDASAAASEVSTARFSDMVTDENLDILAAQVPNDKYYYLADRLGVEYSESSIILNVQSGYCQKAARECLSIWKNKTGGRCTELKRIFESLQLGGLFVDAIYI